MQIWMSQQQHLIVILAFTEIKRSADYSLPKIKMPTRNPDVRYAANPLDYRKLIIPRSFQKDWRPRDPRIVMPRMRQVAAFNNNR